MSATLTIVLITLPIAVTIGLIVFFTRKYAPLVHAIRTSDTIGQLNNVIDAQKERVGLLTEQNDILKEENRTAKEALGKIRKAYEELLKDYELLKKKYGALAALASANQKANDHLDKKLNKVMLEFDEFRDSIGPFMVTALGADPEQVKKLLRQKK